MRTKSVKRMLSEFGPERKAILEKRLNVENVPRCGQHELVKWGARDDDFPRTRTCIYCEHWHKPISSDTCLECLATLHLDNFSVTEEDRDNPQYQYMVKEELEAKSLCGT